QFITGFLLQPQDLPLIDQVNCATQFNFFIRYRHQNSPLHCLKGSLWHRSLARASSYTAVVIHRRILVSSCLAGIPCRYNGKARTNPEILEAVERSGAIALCAEELGNLPTPRPPAEIVGGDGQALLDGLAAVIDINGEDVSNQFIDGAQKVGPIGNKRCRET